MKATVISDASFCPYTKAAGWAAWIVIDGPLRIKESGVLRKHCDASNDAELYALLNGIALAVKANPEIDTMWVQTDCNYVLQLIEAKDKRFFDLYNTLENTPKTLIPRHVKGHTQIQNARSYVNRWCDEHAGIAMRKERQIRQRLNKGTSNGTT